MNKWTKIQDMIITHLYMLRKKNIKNIYIYIFTFIIHPNALILPIFNKYFRILIHTMLSNLVAWSKISQSSINELIHKLNSL